MFDFLSVPPVYLWLAVAVFLGIVEALTMGLTTIWFCGGALVAGLLAYLGAPEIVQIVAFIAVSGVLLGFTRPIAKRKLNAEVKKTNSDALIGEIGIVTKDILPLEVGQVKIKGNVWSAVLEDGREPIPESRKVQVVKIEGVKLIVREANQI